MKRGHIQQGWLNTYHNVFICRIITMIIGCIFIRFRVMNEDRTLRGRASECIPHRDMEIITYVLSGSVQHSDSMGNSGVILPGDVQRMSAGTGILHSGDHPEDKDYICIRYGIMRK